MNWLANKIKTYTHRPAIIYNSQIYTYENLFQKIEYYGTKYSSLHHKIVLLQGVYNFNTIALFFALAEKSNYICTVTNIDPFVLMEKEKLLCPDAIINVNENEDFLTHIDKKRELNPLLNKLQETHNPGVILFSSGTSGSPKVLLHDLNLLLKPYQSITMKDYNILSLLDFDHIGGLDILFRQLSAGATQTIPLNKTPPYICSLIEKHKVSVFSASPTFYNLLFLNDEYKNYNLQSLEILAYGSEPMPQWLLNRLVSEFPNAALQQKYGLSETNAIRIKSISGSLFFKINDPSVEYKVIDNVLWIKSVSQSLGYLNLPNYELQKDGWFCTGDLVEINADGNIRIIGRETDIINVGGEKVLPQEVENILMQLPFIADCKVKGVSNSIMGQAVVAEIVTSGNLSQDIMKAEMRKFLSGYLDRYKIPSKFIFLDNITISERFKKTR